MFVEELKRQVAICSIEEAERIVRLDQDYWNVVSIHGPRQIRAKLPTARSSHYACFDDVQDDSSEHHRAPRAEDLREIYAFVRELDSRNPHAPLLIHCQQGISRSVAVALSWIYQCMSQSPHRTESAVRTILQLRPQAKPNALVLRLGLSQFLPIEQAQRLTLQMINHKLFANNQPETESGQ